MLNNLDRRLFTILLIIFVQMLGSAMILPILPLYAESEFAMTPRTITLLNSVFFAGQFVAGPYLGRLSDRRGRVPVLILSQIGTVISFLMLAFAPSVFWLFAARILDGITGGNIIVARAYVVDVTDPKKRTQSLAYISATFGLGFILGPAVGGLLSAAFGVQVPYVVAAIAAAFTVLLTWWVLDESLSDEIRAKNEKGEGVRLSLGEIGRNAILVRILVIAFIGQFGLGVLQSIFSLYADRVLLADYSEQIATLGIGLLLASFGVFQVSTQVFAVPRLLPRLQEARMVFLGVMVRGIGMFLLAILTSPFLAIAAIAMMAFGLGTSMPALNSLATTAVSDEVRGNVQGVYQSTLNLAIIFSTAISGVLFELQITLPFIIGGILSFITLIPVLPLIKRFDQPKTASLTAD